MPFTESSPNLPDNVKSLRGNKKAQWVGIFNTAFKDCMADGGETGRCETSAFRKANGVVLAAELETEDITGVELARTGTFQAVTGKVTFTRKDFDDMASAHEELKGKMDPPLKLGHNEGQELVQEDGLPSAGWIVNLRRIGDKLVADFARVPKQIAELIRVGALRKRSLEAVRNPEFGGKRFPMVLTAVALLGEDLPAVDSLADIEALYTAAMLDFPEASDEHSKVVIWMVGDSDPDTGLVEALVRDLEALINRADRLIKNRRGAPQLRSLVKSAVDELRRTARATQTNAGQGGNNDMDLKREAVVELLGLDEEVDDDAIMSAIKELQKKVEAGKAGGGNDGDGDGDSDAIKELQKTNADQATRLVTLENDKAKGAATDKVDAAIKAGRFVPAVRDQLVTMALSNEDAFDNMVKNTPAESVLTSSIIGSEDVETWDLSGYEPSKDQLALMTQTGVSRDEFVLQAIEDSGDNVPEKVLAKLRPGKKD